MKSISMLSLLFSVSALASGPTPCEKFVDCGVYQGFQTKEDGHTITREMSFVDIGASKVKFTIASIDGMQRSTDSEQVFAFNEDGSFSVVIANETRATGICKDLACTLSVRPSKYKGELLEQVAVFRFLGASLQMVKLVVDGRGRILPSSVTLAKVNR